MGPARRCLVTVHESEKAIYRRRELAVIRISQRSKFVGALHRATLWLCFDI
jgi:hypothetical protein